MFGGWITPSSLRDHTVALLALAAFACTSSTRKALPAERHAAGPLSLVDDAGAVSDASLAKPDDGMLVRVVPPDPEWAKTTVVYEVGPPDCVIRWTLERSGFNTGIASQHARCAWAMDRQVELLSRLLRAMVEREPLFRRVHFLNTSPAKPELVARVAIAANAQGWDLRRGRPSDGRRVDVFLTELLQQGPPLAEWRALSRAQHLAVTADVDEVDVDEARHLPGFTELAAQGIRPHDKVIGRFVLGLTFNPLP